MQAYIIIFLTVIHLLYRDVTGTKNASRNNCSRLFFVPKAFLNYSIPTTNSCNEFSFIFAFPEVASLYCGTLFACKNGYKCIPKTRLCNGANNCLDYSDEDLATCVANGVIPGKYLPYLAATVTCDTPINRRNADNIFSL